MTVCKHYCQDTKGKKRRRGWGMDRKLEGKRREADLVGEREVAGSGKTSAPIEAW